MIRGEAGAIESRICTCAVAVIVETVLDGGLCEIRFEYR